jgi:hypothetical protein
LSFLDGIGIPPRVSFRLAVGTLGFEPKTSSV